MKLSGDSTEIGTRALMDISHAKGQADILKMENLHLRADLDWFKLRLNQVERERAMLMQDRLGVKISVPEFVPTYEDPASALAQMPDFGSVGADARPEAAATDAEPGEGVDYSLMPGYTGKR
jgi:hypothetical protein